MPEEEVAVRKKIELIVITGVAGAGKTTVAHVCEEKGIYVVEDLPKELFVSLCEVFKQNPLAYPKVAVVIPISDAEFIIRLAKSDPLFEVRAVGLDCSSDSLMSRFRLTRHVHPLQPKGYSLDEAMRIDAELMKRSRPCFDIYIDTTGLTEKDLRKLIINALLDITLGAITVVFSSFGYKYGLPRDAEVVIDARILANPYWVSELSHLTGLDAPVIEYIKKDPKTEPFLQSLYSLIDGYIKAAYNESRNFCFIDVGCSGGQHRSVFVAEQLYEHFKDRYHCVISHRELTRYIDDEKA